MNIFQVRKQSRRAARKQNAVRRFINHHDAKDPAFLDGRRDAAIALFNRQGEALTAARRWCGMYNALPDASPVRCALPKKKQREQRRLAPVAVLEYAKSLEEAKRSG